MAWYYLKINLLRITIIITILQACLQVNALAICPHEMSIACRRDATSYIFSKRVPYKLKTIDKHFGNKL